jgi:ferritin-like metal-binding protein YciE
VELNSGTQVLVEELGSLYSAEKQLVEALPRMATAAHAYELRDLLEAHLEATRVHLERLDQAFADIGVRFIPTGTCKGIAGLIEEANEIIDATGDSVALDAALIGAAQRIEHYEIARYRVARSFADELDLGTTTALLGQTLDEESDADKQLTKLASGGMFSSGINHLAAERTLQDIPADDPEQAAAPVQT